MMLLEWVVCLDALQYVSPAAGAFVDTSQATGRRLAVVGWSLWAVCAHVPLLWLLLTLMIVLVAPVRLVAVSLVPALAGNRHDGAHCMQVCGCCALDWSLVMVAPE